MSSTPPPEQHRDRQLPDPVFHLPGYRVLGVLGTGGFGTVLAARRESDGLDVAIKIVHRDDATACERLLLEADALRVIGPPHVPVLYHQGHDEHGAPYVVFERLFIPSLDTCLGQPLARDEFLTMARAIVVALAAVHQCGYIHCDIKPKNMFVDVPGKQAKLIDFGLARPTATGPGRRFEAMETMEGMVMGTPLYMAPEQCRGSDRCDVRTDVYAVGVVLYEMLTGVTPYAGEPAEVRAAHVSQRSRPPSHLAPVSAELDAVVLRCLAKAPEHRFATMDELAAALGAAGSSAVPAPAPVPASRRPSDPSPQASILAAQSTLVGLLFFDSARDTGAVNNVVTALGGRVVSVSGRRCIAAVGMDTSGDPMVRALDAARALLDQRITERVLVDRDRVRVVHGRGGKPRILATGLHRAGARFPTAGDPPGILVSSTTADSLAEVRTSSVPGHGDRLQLITAAEHLPAVHKGPPLGREQVFKELMDRARDAIQRSAPALATVVGESGHGKSHLAASLAANLGTLPGRVIVLRAREPLGGDKDETLRRLFHATLGAPDRVPEDGGRDLVIARLGQDIGEQVWPAVALIAGWLPASAAQVRRLRAAPTALRSAAARAAGEALLALAAAEPVCFILDDAHFADDVTLDALEYATLQEAGVALWVCALGRPAFVKARPLWGKRAASAYAVTLGPLSDSSAALLCRRLLEPAQNVPAETITRLIQQTRGSPLLLTEIARAVKRHGLIRRHGRGDAWFLATDELEQLPDLPRVEWLAEREIAALPHDLAAHARLLALLGTEFTASEADGVLRELDAEGMGEVFPLDAWVAARRLRDRGLLVTHDHKHLEFRNAIIRDRIARLVPDDLRRHIHKAAFRYYERAADMSENRWLSMVAYHAAHAGEVEHAALLYLHLAERGHGRHNYLDAESMYARALELIPAHSVRCRMDALRGRGLMRYRLSRFEDALDDLRTARSIAEQLDDSTRAAEILLDEATVLDWMRDFSASQARVERARALAPGDVPALLRARLSLGQGRALFRNAHSTRARELLQQAATQAAAIGDDGYETHVIALMLLGYMFGGQGDVIRANQVFETCIALCARRGDRLHLAAVLNNRRELWIAQNNVENAIIDGLHSQRIGREIGQIGVEYVTSFNLAELYYYAGDSEAASPHIRRAVAIEPSCAPKPLARLLEARLLAFAGERDAARSALEHIRAAQHSARAGNSADALLTESETVLLDMIELVLSNADAPSWDQLVARAEASSPRLEHIEVLEMMGLCLMRAGQDARARQIWQRALNLELDSPHPIKERLRSHLARLDSVEKYPDQMV